MAETKEISFDELIDPDNGHVPYGCVILFHPTEEREAVVASGSEEDHEYRRLKWVEQPSWAVRKRFEVQVPVLDKALPVNAAEFTRQDLITFAEREGLDPDDYNTKPKLVKAINAARGLAA